MRRSTAKPDRDDALPEASSSEVQRVLDEAAAATAGSAADEGIQPPSASLPAKPEAKSKKAASAEPKRSRSREATTTAVGVAGGQVAQQAVVDALDRKKLIEVARHVA